MNAIVWCDTRTTEICHPLLEKYNGNINYHKHITGLPINTYFSAFKI
jgi:glycerol kinase